MDISNLTSGYGVQLEQNAVNQFGAAVNTFNSQGGLSDFANPSVSSIRANQGSLGLSSTTITPGNGDWDSISYADDLIAYAPKHRFIFKVKFIFNDPYSRINREFMYLVKEIDKPKVTFEYEDINMYNFKTKVLKSVKHEALNMAFHDDIQNKVLDFFNAYRLAYSPISSLTPEQKDMFEDAGMDFYQPDTGGVNSASMGLLANGNKNVLSHIELVQVYGHGTRQNVYIFTNPRIETFDFDNLSHESSEGNGLTVNFNYDALYIYDDITTGTPDPAWGKTDILGNRESAARNQFGNGVMGGDVTRVQSSVPNPSSPNSIGSTNAVSSAFPKKSAFPSIYSIGKGIISSGISELTTMAITRGAAKPSLSQLTTGTIRNLGYGGLANIGNVNTVGGVIQTVQNSPLKNLDNIPEVKPPFDDPELNRGITGVLNQVQL